MVVFCALLLLHVRTLSSNWRAYALVPFYVSMFPRVAGDEPRPLMYTLCAGDEGC